MISNDSFTWNRTLVQQQQQQQQRSSFGLGHVTVGNPSSSWIESASMWIGTQIAIFFAICD